MASKRPKETQPEPTTPPATTPMAGVAYGMHDHSFTLQAILEMQKTLGKLEASVEKLSESDRETCSKINRIEKIMYAAGVVLIIAIAVGGWFLNTATSIATEYVKASMSSQEQNHPKKE